MSTRKTVSPETRQQAYGGVLDYMRREDKNGHPPLRTLQEHGLFGWLKLLTEGETTSYCKLPTATGKTYLAATIARETGLPAIFLTTSQDLAEQTREKFERAGVSTGIYYEHEKNFDPRRHQVLVVHYDTAIEMLERGVITPQQFKLAFFDEAHLALGEERRKLFDALPHAIRFGMTATPDLDEARGVKKLFGNCAVEATLQQAVDEGCAAPFDAYEFDEPVAPETQAEISRLCAQYPRDPFQQRVINMAPWNRAVVDLYRKQFFGRRSLVVADSIPQAYDCAALFNAEFRPEEFGANVTQVAAVLEGNMSRAERTRVIEDYKAGRIAVLIGKTLLREGLDLPSAEQIFYPPFNRSFAWGLEQHLGRVVRLDEENPNKRAQLIQVRLMPYHEKVDAVSVTEIANGYDPVKGRRRGAPEQTQEQDEKEVLPPLDLSGLQQADAIDWRRVSGLRTYHNETPDYILRERRLKALGYRSATDVASLTGMLEEGHGHKPSSTQTVVKKAKALLEHDERFAAPYGDGEVRFSHFEEIAVNGGGYKRCWLSPELSLAVQEEILNRRAPKGYVSITDFCFSLGNILRYSYDIDLMRPKAEVVLRYVDRWLPRLNELTQNVEHPDHFWNNGRERYLSPQLQTLIEPLILIELQKTYPPRGYRSVGSVAEEKGARDGIVLEALGYVDMGKLPPAPEGRPHLLKLELGGTFLSDALAELVKDCIVNNRGEGGQTRFAGKSYSKAPKDSISLTALARQIGGRNETAWAYVERICATGTDFSLEKDTSVDEDGRQFISKRVARQVRYQKEYERPADFMTIPQIRERVGERYNIPLHDREFDRIVEAVFTPRGLPSDLVRAHPPQVRVTTVGPAITSYGPKAVEKIEDYVRKHKIPRGYEQASKCLEEVNGRGLACDERSLVKFAGKLADYIPSQPYGHAHVIERAIPNSANKERRVPYFSPEIRNALDEVLFTSPSPVFDTGLVQLALAEQGYAVEQGTVLTALVRQCAATGGWRITSANGHGPQLQLPDAVMTALMRECVALTEGRG